MLLLFYDAVCSSDYIVSNDMKTVSDDLDKMWKVAAVA
jgi:hypothetical protein